MKKVLSIILSITMLLSITAGLNLTAFADDLPSSGSCGENVNYTFDSSSGTLTISGTGPMTDYGYGDSPFYSQYDSIKNVIINSGVSSISDYAFSDCWSLTSITIPNSVTSIGEEAFSFCTSLTSATIPERVTSIGENAFVNCKSLISISVDSDNVYYFSQDGVLFNKEKTELIQYPIGNSRTEYEIPYSVISIGDDAFRFCESITSVSIPNSVTSIGRCAFENCDGLKNVTLPNSVRSIDSYAFSACNSLTSVIIPESVTSIDDGAFSFCKSLIGITVDSDNTYYFSEDGVLFNKEKTKLIQYPIGNSRTSYIIPNSVTSIGSDAFSSCYSLTSITIPDSVKYIEYSTFAWCISLTDVYYSGTEADWNSIYIDSDNDYLINATIHYNSETPQEEKIHEGEIVDNFIGDYGEYNDAIKINTSWFFNDSKTYNHNISILCSLFNLEGYQSEENLKNALKRIGFLTDVDYINLDTGRDEVNYFIARQKIANGDEIYNLVFMGCIGSNKKQWNSNFDPKGTESKTNYEKTDSSYVYNHYGFNDAKNFAKSKLTDYLKKYGLRQDNTKILLTGHSRGAATANLIAAELIDDGSIVNDNNLFTYTYATPNNTWNPKRNNKKYDRIFNIVFPNDFVTKVLLSSWGYGRFGTTYSLPTKQNDKKNYKNYYKPKMLDYYKHLNYIADKERDTLFSDYWQGEKPVYRITKVMGSCVKNLYQYYNQDYNLTGLLNRKKPYDFFQEGLCPFVNGSKDTSKALEIMLEGYLGINVLYKNISAFFIAGNKFSSHFEDAHKMVTYTSFMMSMNENEVTTKRKSYKGTVNCPVDIEVYDKDSNELVGRIVNDTVDEEIAEKDNAIFMDVDEEGKTYWLPSNGNYEVKLIGNDNGKMDYSVQEIDSDLGEVCRSNFYDVELKKGEAYTGEFDAETFDIDAYSITDENGKEIQADERFDPENTIEYMVNVNTVGSGNATNSLTVTSGDYVTLYAETICSDFIGWYKGDELLSTETTYRFRPSDNVEYTAKFTEAIHHSFNNSVTSPTCTEKGYTNYECAVCGYSYKDNYTNALGHDFGNNGKQCKRCKITNPNYKEPVTQKTAKTVSKVNLEKVKGLKVKASKKKIKVIWKKVSGVSGYQIQYSLKKNMKKSKKKTVKGAKKTKVTIKKLKSKKKYYVRIRTYKVAGGKKIYSKWSKIKKVKVK